MLQASERSDKNGKEKNYCVRNGSLWCFVAARLRRVLPAEFAALAEIKRPRSPEALKMERVRRVELPTLCLASIRSSQLSYTRIE
jgi:hypothetical protein